MNMPQSKVQTKPLPQYGIAKILAVWAAAALPMALLAWIVTPWFAGRLSGPNTFARALVLCLMLGLIWQFVLVLVLVLREQNSLRWGIVKQALWLQKPSDPKTGKTTKKVWGAIFGFTLLFSALSLLIPSLPHPDVRDLGVFLASDAGKQFFSHNWLWYGITVCLLAFNTILGEELLFRGFLLPRMQKAFGTYDWLANGVLFALYHLHEWWVIPSALLDAVLLAYPTKRYRSAWAGIIIHSAQSAFFAILLLGLVLA